MDKFITQIVVPFSQSSAPDKLALFETDLQIFVSGEVKNELATLNKELAKKSRDLFIFSADNEALKQNVNQLQNTLSQLKSQVSLLQQEKAKNKLITQKQIGQLNKNVQNLDREIKKEVNRAKNQKDLMEELHKLKLKQLDNYHQKQLNRVIDEEKKLQDEQVELLKAEFQQDKQRIIKSYSDARRQLIKKYEQKITKIQQQNAAKYYDLSKEHELFKKQTRQNSNDFLNQISSLESQISKLSAELSKQKQLHQKYLLLYEQVYQQFSQNQQKSLEDRQQLEDSIHKLKIKLLHSQKLMSSQIRELNDTLASTVAQNNEKYSQTVENMTTQSKMKLQELQTKLVEEREIALNLMEVERDKENYENHQRIKNLEADYLALLKKHNGIESEYEKKLKKITQENSDFIESLNMRRQYEVNVNGKNAEREFNELKTKYELEIKAIYRHNDEEKVQMQQRQKDQKIAITNKLTGQYESMINDQKASYEIQVRQKIIEFDRKTKNFQAKLKDADKKRNQLKLAAERTKMEMQMRIDSMVQLNQAYEQEIAKVNEKMQNFEREKQRIINQYQLKLLLVKNQSKTTQQGFESRQNDLKQLLQSKLRAKNSQITKILSRVKKQTELLVQSNERRVEALQKEYAELKRVIGQKTSLPQDIEALKVFHTAYIQKEKQLEQQKLKVEQLWRQLRSKDAIDKVFAQKGIKTIHKKQIPSSIGSLMMTYKSQNL